MRQESDLGHALITFEDGDFDLIVICHSVPEKDRLRIVANAKRIKPSTLVLLVTKDTYGEAARLADASVHSLEGPEVLLGCVAGLLKRNDERQPVLTPLG